MTISLQNIRLKGAHGIHVEERLVKNEFELNVDLKYNPAGEVIQSIKETIDYVSVFELVKAEFDKPTALLETLAMRMAGEIIKQHKQVCFISINIKKLHPPIEKFKGAVGITYVKDLRT
ncbi:MAG: dihydroneopterin aldolase [Flavisolibacter sp.]|jgi:dihydroneopterin aldolase|nr:dihydroneopterin aldolase [Flavisolibacter sp.]